MGGAPAGARESASFDVSIEDYRRAFALAIASWPEEAPSMPLWRRAFDHWWLTGAMGVLGAGIWVIYFSLGGVPVFALLGDLAVMAAIFVPLLIGAGLLTASAVHWDAKGARKRFPRERSVWKRPQRMRILWSEAGLVTVGDAGFVSFGWNVIHAWVEGDARLVIFTGVNDPVPVPYAALGEDGLDDLRHRLHARGVPQEWRPESVDAFGLKRVFD